MSGIDVASMPSEIAFREQIEPTVKERKPAGRPNTGWGGPGAPAGPNPPLLS